MLLLGASPRGRFTEQHDIFFSIAENPASLIPSIKQVWPEATDQLHVDAWREVNTVDGYTIDIVPKQNPSAFPFGPRLFFINLGGYKKNEFDEFHYKILVAAMNKGEAVKKAKETAFYKHMGFKGATSHIDDKYGVDVDDLYEITDILPHDQKEKYSIVLTQASIESVDEIHLGYFTLDKLPQFDN